LSELKTPLRVDTIDDDYGSISQAIDSEGKPVMTWGNHHKLEEVCRRVNVHDELRTALHDAICRPKGVVPESAEKFVTDDELAAVRRALEDKIVLEPGAAVETHSKVLK